MRARLILSPFGVAAASARGVEESPDSALILTLTPALPPVSRFRLLLQQLLPILFPGSPPPHVGLPASALLQLTAPPPASPRAGLASQLISATLDDPCSPRRLLSPLRPARKNFWPPSATCQGANQRFRRKIRAKMPFSICHPSAVDLPQNRPDLPPICRPSAPERKDQRLDGAPAAKVMSPLKKVC